MPAPLFALAKTALTHWSVAFGRPPRKSSMSRWERLDKATAATQNIVRNALARRSDEAFGVQPELDRLAAASELFAVLHEELQTDQPAQPA
jgi:hypothetical protein